MERPSDPHNQTITTIGRNLIPKVRLLEERSFVKREKDGTSLENVNLGFKAPDVR